MKSRLLFFLIYLFFASPVFSQETEESKDETEASLDLLKAPSSPAFQILEVSDEKIERPGTATDFWVSIKQATNSYSVIPNNYAIELAPYWIFGKQKLSFDKLMEKKDLGNVFNQSFSISFATTTNQDTVNNIDYRKLAVGFRFSVIRGEIDKEYAKKLNSLRNSIAKVWNNYSISFLDKDEAYKSLKALGDKIIKDTALTQEVKEIELAKVSALINERHADLKRQFEADKKEEMMKNKEELENLKLSRTGWNVDFAAAIGLDFPTNEFSMSYVNKFGLWLTGSYELKEKVSFLGVSRLMFIPRTSITDDNGNSDTATLANIDIGLKINFDGIERFSLSGEVLARKFMKKNNPYGDDVKWRYTLNLGYEILKNKSLTFSVGKEFDKNPQFGGSLIAALNLVLGFGSERVFK